MDEPVDLIRDLLDKIVIDRTGRPLGCVDGIVLEVRANRPPRVVGMELGVMTLARRLHPALARVLRALVRRWSPRVFRTARLPLQKILHVDIDLTLDVDGKSDPKLLRLEKWLTRHIVSAIPGGRP